MVFYCNVLAMESECKALCENLFQTLELNFDKQHMMFDDTDCIVYINFGNVSVGVLISNVTYQLQTVIKRLRQIKSNINNIMIKIFYGTK